MKLTPEPSSPLGLSFLRVPLCWWSYREIKRQTTCFLWVPRKDTPTLLLPRTSLSQTSRAQGNQRFALSLYLVDILLQLRCKPQGLSKQGETHHDIAKPTAPLLVFNEPGLVVDDLASGETGRSSHLAFGTAWFHCLTTPRWVSLLAPWVQVLSTNGTMLHSA